MELNIIKISSYLSSKAFQVIQIQMLFLVMMLIGEIQTLMLHILMIIFQKPLEIGNPTIMSSGLYQMKVLKF